MNGAKVLLLGVTYKANVSDLRESPAAPLAERLVAWGAEVSFHDAFVESWTFGPASERWTVDCVADAYAAAREADLVVLLQAHAEYDLPAFAEAATTLLDTRGVVVPGDSVIRL